MILAPATPPAVLVGNNIIRHAYIHCIHLGTVPSNSSTTDASMQLMRALIDTYCGYVNISFSFFSSHYHSFTISLSLSLYHIHIHTYIHTHTYVCTLSHKHSLANTHAHTHTTYITHITYPSIHKIQRLTSSLNRLPTDCWF